MESRAVVRAVAACLNDDASREAEPGAQCEQHIRSRIIGQILGLRTEGEVRHWTKDVAMGIDRSQRRSIARLRRIRMPADDAERAGDRKSTRSELQSLMRISYAVFCLQK